MTPDGLDVARAAAVRDLCAYGQDDAATVTLLDDVIAKRRWWLEEWPDGEPFLPGLIAQDLQDVLLDSGLRWPQCRHCDDGVVHSLHVEPPLDADPAWVCDEAAVVVARVGHLGS